MSYTYYYNMCMCIEVRLLLLLLLNGQLGAIVKKEVENQASNIKNNNTEIH